MTLDAMHWVWSYSQSKGNTRLALLAVADRVRSLACEVRLSYADFSHALNASRSVAKEAVRKAVEIGELEVVEQGKGTRSSLYRLPKAVGYARSAASSGPESGPLAPPTPPPSGPDSGTQAAQHDHASGPDSGTEWAGFRPSSGPDSGPHTQYASTSQLASRPQGDRQQGGSYGIPAAARPLVDGLTAAGVTVRWPFRGNGWFPVLALVEKCGVPAMVAHAVKAARRADVQSASYFMRGWGELPPAVPTKPEPSNAAMPPHCGDPDCDPDTRYRETERDGLPELTPCHLCHPHTQGARQ